MVKASSGKHFTESIGQLSDVAVSNRYNQIPLDFLSLLQGEGMFVIEDEIHAEPQCHFDSIDQAIEELRRRAAIPWDQYPNCAPCANWRDCGRAYEIVEYDDSRRPWKELRRISALEVSATGFKWADGFAEAYY